MFLTKPSTSMFLVMFEKYQNIVLTMQISDVFHITLCFFLNEEEGALKLKNQAVHSRKIHLLGLGWVGLGWVGLGWG